MIVVILTTIFHIIYPVVDCVRKSLLDFFTAFYNAIMFNDSECADDNIDRNVFLLVRGALIEGIYFTRAEAEHAAKALPSEAYLNMMLSADPELVLNRSPTQVIRAENFDISTYLLYYKLDQ